MERLDDGHATILLPTYEHEGQETVVVTYLGSELAESVRRRITFVVQKQRLAP